MKERAILPLVLTMSLPMVLSMLVSSLYNIVDSYFVAKISEDAMTALSLVFPVQNFINAVTIGFSIGVNAVISYFLGAQEQEKANSAASQGLLLSAIHGVILTVGCIAAMPAFLRMFTDDELVISLGLRYSNIAFAFAVVIALGMCFEKIYQAVGKMTVAMVCVLSGCIANIILDPVLIFGLGPFPELGIEGAALATGIGQSLSLVIYLVVYLLRPLPLRLSLKCLSFRGALTGRLYAIGVPATLNLALPSLLVSALNIILSGFSQTYVVILGIYYKLQTFLYLPANGIIQGIRPLVGYNYGAGEHRRVSRIYTTGPHRRHHGPGHRPVLGAARPAHGPVYRECRDHLPGGRCSAHHQPGLCAVLGIRSVHRCAGGVEHGRTILGHYCPALCGGHHPHRLPAQPRLGCPGGVVGLPCNGGPHRRAVLFRLPPGCPSGCGNGRLNQAKRLPDGEPFCVLWSYLFQLSTSLFFTKYSTPEYRVVTAITATHT